MDSEYIRIDSMWRDSVIDTDMYTCVHNGKWMAKEWDAQQDGCALFGKKNRPPIIINP